MIDIAGFAVQSIACYTLFLKREVENSNPEFAILSEGLDGPLQGRPEDLLSCRAAVVCVCLHNAFHLRGKLAGCGRSCMEHRELCSILDFERKSKQRSRQSHVALIVKLLLKVMSHGEQ